MIILGIDPGSVRIGYGVIKKNHGKLTHLKSGLLKLPQTDHANRLVAIEKDLNNLLQKFQPDRVGLEKLFFVKNQKTALGVSEARGVILNTLAKKSLPFFEITPSEVKLAVTGDGRASKKSVAKMVNYFLGLELGNVVIDDITDALAIAIAVSGRNIEVK
ncbi:MAG: crossover junction endodeoxyribonuclease RuvC [Patescibacteria group bacterium]|nr:crossover junction endodeoxyribonuclease RuvC [Patescibacteria group bacterium]